jgi:hypothetical protein
MLGRVARFFDETMHPAWYHSAIATPPYFEGWYFKCVSPDQGARYAIIPGIFLNHDPAREHAFVQVFDGVTGRATYHRYPAREFVLTPGTFDLRVGPNHFTLRGFQLDIDDRTPGSERRVRGDVQFGALSPWPVSITAPGIMGPFGWIPVMECYHGLLSFDHALYGALEDDGVQADFTGGRGYIEKDWGRSFPAAWVWMQTNHFSTPETSLCASIAIIPSFGSWFPGFIVGLRHLGRLYRFTTYAGGRATRLEVDGARVFWTLVNATHRIEITATRAEASILPGPSRDDMGKRVPETIRASIEVKLMELSGDVVFHEHGSAAALEIAGEIERLQAAVKP